MLVDILGIYKAVTAQSQPAAAKSVLVDISQDCAGIVAQSLVFDVRFGM